jgi:hypothetical protein
MRRKRQNDKVSTDLDDLIEEIIVDAYGEQNAGVQAGSVLI